MKSDDLLRDLPVGALDLCFRLEIEQTKVKHLLRFLLDLLRVVQTFDSIAAFEQPLELEDVAQWLGIVFTGGDLAGVRVFLDRTERLHHEHGMMRYNRAPPFAHDCRMRDAFGIANLHDVVNDVVGVFLKRIIGRAVKTAA
jgi:hypothetical protein